MSLLIALAALFAGSFLLALLMGCLFRSTDQGEGPR